uniref:Uncharacterized protein n=1 Tax=Clostridium botulinum TaxID=1491 RepID=A0A126JHW6_CLOBO|nr:hypothetical protein [Clostridium botulinum]
MLLHNIYIWCNRPAPSLVLQSINGSDLFDFLPGKILKNSFLSWTNFKIIRIFLFIV